MNHPHLPLWAGSSTEEALSGLQAPWVEVMQLGISWDLLWSSWWLWSPFLATKCSQHTPLMFGALRGSFVSHSDPSSAGEFGILAHPSTINSQLVPFQTGQVKFTLCLFYFDTKAAKFPIWSMSFSKTKACNWFWDCCQCVKPHQAQK